VNLLERKDAGQSIDALHRVGIKGSACRVFGSDMRISGKGKRFFYPDLSVLCGPTLFHYELKDTATNPTLVIEVLSLSTAAYDRGAKFLSYQGIASLQEYVLVHQDRAMVEQYTRRPDDTWIYQKVEGLKAVLQLPSIQGFLRLEEVYLSVFPA
jgi:Uma2 family endonuclease